MKQDGLRNLEQWVRVLEQLEEWKRAGQLDSHQDDLLWLLRFRGNWRLREAALEMMPSLRTPDPELIRTACTILMDENIYDAARILAAEAVTALLPGSGGARPRSELTAEVREQIHALLESHQAPVLHVALRRLLPRIE